MGSIDAKPLNDALQEAAKESARDVANRWFSGSQETLRERGDEADYDYFPVLQGGRPPEWVGRGWQFSYPHQASEYFEFGTEAHTITPTQADMLVFEWEDAPPEVREMFSDTFPTVFFKQVEVDGIDELRFVRDSRDEVAREVSR
jgi:hypothetical protein